MSFIMPEIVIRKVIDYGIKNLRKNKPAFDDLFSTLTENELKADYGEAYREKIWKWFLETKIPVIQAWSFNAQKIPCISVHLANETEDESKAALNDFAGVFDDNGETGTGVFTVMIDIGIHANRGGDHVLWMYYIISYILFKHKRLAEKLGLKLHTYNASDYTKDTMHMAENTWTRWIRFRCTTQNFWQADEFTEIDSINLDTAIGLEPAWSISTSNDVNESDVDTTANSGLLAGRIGDDDGEEDTNI